MFMIIIYTIAFNIPNIADFLNYMGSIFCSVLEVYINAINLVHFACSCTLFTFQENTR